MSITQIRRIENECVGSYVKSPKSVFSKSKAASAANCALRKIVFGRPASRSGGFLAPSLRRKAR